MSVVWPGYEIIYRPFHRQRNNVVYRVRTRQSRESYKLPVINLFWRFLDQDMLSRDSFIPIATIIIIASDSCNFNQYYCDNVILMKKTANKNFNRNSDYAIHIHV